MEMRFWIPSLDSEQTFWAKKDGGPQHVFTQKMISQQRLVSCACISGANCSSRVHPVNCSRGIPGFYDSYLFWNTFPYFCSSPPHPSQQKCEYETEKWRREGRSRFLTARHWRLEGRGGGRGGGEEGEAVDEDVQLPTPMSSKVSIMFPWHS